MRSDTRSVSIQAPAEFTWRKLSDLACWSIFSPFVTECSLLEEGVWSVRSPQGTVVVRTHFDAHRLLLDHVVELAAGPVLIPYRVVPNLDGSELVMTNFQSPGDSVEEYEEQLDWMIRELDGARSYIEELYAQEPHS